MSLTALFNQQLMYDRQIAVRMDKWVDPILQEIPTRMPIGLKSLGVGFGSGGLPLLNIAQISSQSTHLFIALLHGPHRGSTLTVAVCPSVRLVPPIFSNQESRRNF